MENRQKLAQMTVEQWVANMLTPTECTTILAELGYTVELFTEGKQASSMRSKDNKSFGMTDDRTGRYITLTF